MTTQRKYKSRKEKHRYTLGHQYEEADKGKLMRRSSREKRITKSSLKIETV